MRQDQLEIPADLGQFAERLDTMVHADQTAAEFWEHLLESYCVLSGSPRAVLLVRREGESNWRQAAYYETNKSNTPTLPLPKFQQLAIQAAEKTLESEGETLPAGRDGVLVLGVRLRLLTEENTCVAVFLFVDVSETALREILGRLQLVSTAPKTFQMQQAVRSSKEDADRFAKVLEILVPVNEEDRFLAAALALCNGLATSLECERVSLGWREGGFIRLHAISRMEKFDRKMAAAQALETAMDEALEQDAVVRWPATGENVVARDHQRFSREYDVDHVVSVPLRLRAEGLAVVTCERQGRDFSSLELQQIHLVAELTTPRLAALRSMDRWFGARWADGTRRRLASLVGPEHTWAKILALFFAALLGVLIFWPVDYRVEGDFILRSHEVAYLTTPYDGYIEEVYHEVPAVVTKGEILLTLQTDQLKLEEAAELANLNAYIRQVERARAGNQLADMRIAEAQVSQAEARLAIVRDRLAHATVRAPFDAVIIEGDLRELRGKPIERGNPLFKLARLDNLFVEAKIDERDIHEIGETARGEIAFVSQPKFKFPVKVAQMEAAAFPEGEANVFQLHCDLLGPPEPWWRPGMKGVCKIAAGQRSLLWIFGHRTVDFFRLWLWW